MLTKYFKVTSTEHLCALYDNWVKENKYICIGNGQIAQKSKYKCIKDVGMFLKFSFCVIIL